ncbi:hypothetical protein TNIN_447291 [Trichonephila inaurata madagascariensis]|uniref:Uncharacterized protein n=1 Tax=Trichonephila inaurata madagascariensis TaxID=2747483 RepID=A0A8X7CNX6_9ARAC|nr:hypothetical protein TNIN_447291 [Trichonephila inaurata madagascariensis]
MTRKQENEAPREQKSRRESNRLRTACLNETEQEETISKSNCLQMMQGRISETAEDREERLECERNVTRSSRMAVRKDKENIVHQ